MTEPAATPVRPRQHRHSRLGPRAGAACIAALLLAVLGLAAYLTPDPAGIGTHQRLGLQPCGWMTAMGKPCPTCGMTTAFAEAAHARPVRSFRAQPFGFVLSILTASGFWACVHVTLTGSRIGETCANLLRPRFMWLVVAAAAAAWAYKLWTVSRPGHGA